MALPLLSLPNRSYPLFIKWRLEILTMLSRIIAYKRFKQLINKYDGIYIIVIIEIIDNKDFMNLKRIKIETKKKRKVIYLRQDKNKLIWK